VATIERLEKRLADLGTRLEVSERKYNTTYWKYYAYHHLLIKLSLIIESNFRFVETLSLLATVRYVFEALVWLRVLRKDDRYGLVAYHHLGSIHAQQAKEQKRKMEDEIHFYEKLVKDEQVMMKELVKSRNAGQSLAHLAKGYRFISEEVDRRARREFNLYADEAKENGYSVQVLLLREQGLPRVEERIAIVATEQADLERRVPGNIRPLTKQRWNWKAQAESIGMGKQYEFIYSHTSRMLHATPFSFALNQKNLEFEEVRIFLEYLYVPLLDSVETVEKDIGAIHGH
jgi:nucleotide-binding universal stress UspA family protein